MKAAPSALVFLVTPPFAITARAALGILND